jgi:hypothetical protein
VTESILAFRDAPGASTSTRAATAAANASPRALARTCACAGGTPAPCSLRAQPSVSKGLAGGA